MPTEQGETDMVVLDTNVVLDLWLFEDPRFAGLAQALSHSLRWVATAEMREELSRVLQIGRAHV